MTARRSASKIFPDVRQWCKLDQELQGLLAFSSNLQVCGVSVSCNPGLDEHSREMQP